ncbi:Sly1 protein homolog, putative [Brugia malayi]|nr:Sly1 protein homolog, putative [Brugia malayi]CTP81551.1 Bm13830 [Brugia malayi]VIO92735.1 Sly1 protein homolog, putative [Brugia malayi]
MNDQTENETIRMRQIASLKQLLNLNQPLPVSMAVEPVWKILILDRYGQDIISPLLTIKQLRDMGITLHLLLGSHREILPDVPAIYFISPTDENIKIICDDLNKGMYDSYYLNMISPLSRPRLEQLASAAVCGGTVQHVQKLMDQFLNFISLEDDLFVLRRYNDNSPFSFYAISDPTVTPEQMEILIDTIVDGLFSVCATLGVVPIIRCLKDNAAEQVAVRLDQKLRDNFRDARNNLFVQDSVRAGRLIIHRPVLIIADRGMDIATMLRHTWTYQALIHDLLDLDLNRVIIKDESGRRKEYDMNSRDKLWMGHKGSAFPLVAEAIQEEVEAYKNSEDEIKRLKHAMGMDDLESDETVSLLSDATAKLTSTVGSLPELLEKKRLIDLHTTVATAILNQIKQRKLDVLFEAEEKIMNGLLSNASVIELMRQSSVHEDTLRIMLINYLCSSNTSKNELKEQADYLKEIGMDDAAVKYVKQLRSISNMSLNRVTNDYSGGGIKTDNMFANLLNRGSQLFMEGVKNLVPKKHNLPLTKMVDAIITGNLQCYSRSDAEFRYYDPKLMHSSGKEPQRARGNPPQDVIVFVIGGGNYVEYQNVVDYGKSKGLARITYGCTELVNPKQFVEQLTRLGREMS